MIDTTLLLVADDKRLAASVEGALTSQALKLRLAASCAEAVNVLEEVGPALVIVHVAARAAFDGVAALLRHLAGAGQVVPTLLLCEADLANEGLTLLRLGAADCLMRPLDLARLAYLVDVLTIRHRLAPCPKAKTISSLGETHSFIYRDDSPLGQVLGQARRVAPLETSVLIQGETGTGKTRLAQLIHELSPRREQPFLTINCGALSANLIESELFGHVRGAFTGADRDRTGKLAAVGAGTLLLDDIDGLPLELQPKLLRVIEERVFEPVGSNKQEPLRARLIAASNRPLQQEAQAGKFRMDLYYRLGVIVFHLPPFRENRGLVAALARHFVQQYAARDDCLVRGLTPPALRALENYDWPGNVRELRNVIERGVALCDGPWIDLADLPEPLCAAQPVVGPVPVFATGSKAAPPPGDLQPIPMQTAPATTLTERKQAAEAQVILEVLTRHNNNKLRAAAELGISRMTLYNKLHQFGLIGPSADPQPA